MSLCEMILTTLKLLKRRKGEFYLLKDSSHGNMFYWFSISHSVKTVVTSSRWLKSHFKTKVLVCLKCTVVCVELSQSDPY